MGGGDGRDGRRGWRQEQDRTGQGLKSHGKDLGCYLNIQVKLLTAFKKNYDKILLALRDLSKTFSLFCGKHWKKAQ